MSRSLKRLLIAWLVAEAVVIIIAWPSIWATANTLARKALPSPTPVYTQNYVAPAEYHFKETPPPCSIFVNPEDGKWAGCVNRR